LGWAQGKQKRAGVFFVFLLALLLSGASRKKQLSIANRM